MAEKFLHDPLHPSSTGNYYFVQDFESDQFPFSYVIISIVGHLEGHWLAVITEISAPVSRRPENLFLLINKMSSRL